MITEEIRGKIKTMLELIGFEEPAINVDPESRKIEIFLSEGEWLKKWLPTLVSDLDHLTKLFIHKEKGEIFFIDINNYRKEREHLIVEIAKAAAKKASSQKELVKLPAMNSYERRLVHVELAVHPEVKTESEGEGRERCVIVKPI